MEIVKRKTDIRFNESEISKARELEYIVNKFANRDDFNCIGVECKECPFKYPDNVCAFTHLRLLSRYIYDVVNFGGNSND